MKGSSNGSRYTESRGIGSRGANLTTIAAVKKPENMLDDIIERQSNGSVEEAVYDKLKETNIHKTMYD